MPLLPPVPKVVRFDLLQSVLGDAAAQDRYFLQYSGTLNAADLGTVLATASASWNTNIAPILQNEVVLNGIRGTDLSSPSSPQVFNSSVHAGAGVGSSVGGLAFVIRFKIARRYRGGHPRFYLPGIAATSVGSNGLWAAAAQNSVLAGWQNFIAAAILNPPAAVGTLTQVNVSYFAGFTVFTNPVTHRARNVPSLRPGGPVVDVVTAVAVNPKPASQRRRNVQTP